MILEELRTELARNSDEATKKSGMRFFKEDVKLYGIKSAVVKRIARDKFKEIKHLPKKEIFGLCETLWKSGYMEDSFVACDWAYSVQKNFAEDDFIIFDKWVNKYVSNWASCDTFCNHTIGTFVEKYPAYLEMLKKWAISPNRWVRRASAVSLIVPAKKGLFLKDVFEIADILLTDSDDMVRKGYGWMLKVASAKHEDEVFNYVIKNKNNMPRTSLRYAIENMSQSHKKLAMLR